MNNCGCQYSSAAAMQLAQAGFVLLDLTLYLDTHPDCPHGLRQFAIAKAEYEQAVEIYRQQVGPVRAYDVNPTDGWTWGETPWPWEV